LSSCVAFVDQNYLYISDNGSP